MIVETARRSGPPLPAAAFEDFYRRERPALCRALALSLRDHELAVEAVDEGMVRAYQRWRQVGAYDNPAGWVYRVARNWAISRSRRRWRSVSVATVTETAVDAPPPADDALAAALAALPEPQRAVVVLRYHLDWSVEQAAAALGVPPGTVKSRLHRALATLRATMEDAR